MSRKLLCLMSFVLVLALAGIGMAQIDPATITDGHMYRSGGASDGAVPDSSAVGHTANIIGDPQLVEILGGRALQFDGVDDGVHIPDSQWINVTNGPFPNRTVLAIFNCPDVSKPDPQVVFQEGGGTRGFNIYVQANEVIVGGWNKAEYQWNPGSWISAPIASNEWHAVALVLRDGGDAQEDDKFEMWMDGALIGKAPGGQMYNHGNDNSFGYSKNNTVYPDGAGGSATASGESSYYEGVISQVWILNQALTEAELAPLMVAPQPVGTPLYLAPVDGVQIEETSQMLTWRPGELSTSHNVYMGTDADAVAAGTAPAVSATQGLVTAGIAGGPIPDGLQPDTTYYWRVESVNDVNPDSPWSSAVMSISLPPRRAYDPSPIDGNKVLDLSATLAWTGGWSPIMHNVNFGTDPAALMPVSMMQMDATYDAGPLEPDTTYYWRIDEFYGFETIEGPVWSFSTVPVLPLADDPNLI
ncbi:MAG: LamG-like jellyroll fold domain-containing protein, partial [Planctomycetota bacterium]